MEQTVGMSVEVILIKLIYIGRPSSVWGTFTWARSLSCYYKWRNQTEHKQAS